MKHPTGNRSIDWFAPLDCGFGRAISDRHSTERALSGHYPRVGDHDGNWESVADMGFGSVRSDPVWSSWDPLVVS